MVTPNGGGVHSNNEVPASTPTPKSLFERVNNESIGEFWRESLLDG